MGRSRHKLGSRSYKNYSFEMLNLAVDLVSRNKMSSLEAEKRFYIPRRTIENKVKNMHFKPPGGQQRLSVAEEQQIAKVLIAAADFGSPLSRFDLSLMVFNYLKINRKEHLFEGKPPGKCWINNFLVRHKDLLTERAVQNIKRVRAATTSANFEFYFENLKMSLKDIPPKNILNYDETNLSDNPGSTKCIFKRKVKYPERVMNSTKGNISIMFAAAADGTVLPTYTVYKADHLWTSWCENGPKDARYNRTKSGWFDTTVFEDWFKSVIIPWADKLEGPKIIIGDNLSSHLNIDIVRKCEELNIRFTFLPPNSTHISQPLDVAFFGPLKRKWRNILTQHKIDNPGETQLNKAHFPMLLKSLIESIEISNKVNICSGFRATGIVPFNPQKILQKLPEYDEENKYTVDNALLDYLKANRAANPTPKTKNKKVNVAPGKSVSSQEVEVLIRTKKNNSTKSIKGKKKPKLDTQTFPDPETTTSDALVDLPDNETAMQTESISSREKVTILSDVKFSPYNGAYTDLTKMNSLKLNTIDKTFNIFASQNKENLLVTQVEDYTLSEPINYDNPIPSTSTQSLTISKKRRLLKKTTPDTPKKGRLWKSDESSDDDNYSLRDTSDEEYFMPSESEASTVIQEEKSPETEKLGNVSTFQVNSFVLVKFCGLKSNKYYVGKIMEVCEDSGLLVKFMRKRKEQFYWPDIEDISLIFRSDIEMILETPLEGRRGQLRFECINSSEFNVQ